MTYFVGGESSAWEIPDPGEVRQNLLEAHGLVPELRDDKTILEEMRKRAFLVHDVRIAGQGDRAAVVSWEEPEVIPSKRSLAAAQIGRHAILPELGTVVACTAAANTVSPIIAAFAGLFISSLIAGNTYDHIRLRQQAIRASLVDKARRKLEQNGVRGIDLRAAQGFERHTLLLHSSETLSSFTTLGLPERVGLGEETVKTLDMMRLFAAEHPDGEGVSSAPLQVQGAKLRDGITGDNTEAYAEFRQRIQGRAERQAKADQISIGDIYPPDGEEEFDFLMGYVPEPEGYQLAKIKSPKMINQDNKEIAALYRQLAPTLFGEGSWDFDSAQIIVQPGVAIRALRDLLGNSSSTMSTFLSMTHPSLLNVSGWQADQQKRQHLDFSAEITRTMINVCGAALSLRQSELDASFREQLLAIGAPLGQENDFMDDNNPVIQRVRAEKQTLDEDVVQCLEAFPVMPWAIERDLKKRIWAFCYKNRHHCYVPEQYQAYDMS